MAIATEERRPVGGPPLPMGRRVELPGRGTTFVREVPGPEGAPTVLLLHGWLASAGLNWFTAYDMLGDVQRASPPTSAATAGACARGGASRSPTAPTTSPPCSTSSTPVRSSPSATASAARSPSCCGGAAPTSSTASCCAPRRTTSCPACASRCSSARSCSPPPGARGSGMLAAQVPAGQLRRLVPAPAEITRPSNMRDWARAEMRRHDYRHILEAGVAMSNYHARWIDEVDVPTAVVITTKDRAVNPLAQARMAFKIPGASIHRIDDGHIVCAKQAFGPALARRQRRRRPRLQLPRDLVPSTSGGSFESGQFVRARVGLAELAGGEALVGGRPRAGRSCRRRRRTRGGGPSCPCRWRRGRRRSSAAAGGASARRRRAVEVRIDVLEPADRLDERGRLGPVLLHELGHPVGEVAERPEEQQPEPEQAAGDGVGDLLEQVRRVGGAVPADEDEDEPERGEDAGEHHQGALAELERAAAGAQLAHAVGEALQALGLGVRDRAGRGGPAPSSSDDVVRRGRPSPPRPRRRPR